MKYLTILAVSLLVSSCGGNPSNQKDTELGNTSSNKTTSELNNATSKWSTFNLKDYQYQFHKSCYCLPENTREILVYVKNSSVYEAYYVESGEAVTGDEFTKLFTVEQWFAFIAQEANKKPDAIKITYNTEKGYPETIAIDYYKQIADDEISYIISDFM